MKDVGPKYWQITAMKRALLVIIALAVIVCASLLIRRSDAANYRSRIRVAASVVPAGLQAPTTFKPVVSTSVANGISRPARDLAVVLPRVPTTWEGDAPRPIHPPHAPPTLPVHDPVQQTVAASLAMPAPIGSFDGIDQAGGCGNCIPPDPNGDVGPNHYVEMVNSSFAVYSKTGTLLAGPTNINSLFQGLSANAPCRLYNDGDPVVVYDQIADRWVLSQFAVNGGSGPYDECFAISTTPNPAGTYFVYDFHLSDTVFHDYPKLGVWPDAYYMTTNQFGGAGQTFSGAGAFAFERDKMLLGQTARMVFFDEGLVNSSFGGMLPSDLDGTGPPTGSPNYFAEVDSPINTPSLGADAMRIWKFHVDWSNTANSTFGLNGQPNSILPVAMWNPSQCVEGQGTCVPQLGSPYMLDVIGDRIMFRLAYRNFGDHESLVVNHSVLADARIGVRWYEVRSPGSSPTIFQQGTFAPTDALYRWMGSIAMDHVGNIAVGYSTSSAADYPSIAYAGRLTTDPLGQLSQGEAQLFAGTGSENVGFYVPPVGRWGDYSDLTVDPADDCTFWYVNEYFNDVIPDPGAPWRTRIGSFKFPGCTNVPVCTRSNVALASNGSTAVASSEHSSGGYPAASAINGDRTGNNWGNSDGWADGTRGVYPDTLEINFPTTEVIDEIDVFTLQNNWRTAGQPDLTTSCSGEGILDFDVQYWNGTGWLTVTNGSVTANDKAWRQFSFTAVTTTKIRIVVNNSRNNYSRIVGVEAYGCPS
jgi:hypothetical protein